MENTAIEEHKSRKQYLDESSSKLSGGEITDFEDTCDFGYENILKVVYFAMNRHELASRKELQAKHEEELKQAVIKTFHFARNYGTGFDDGEQYYEANFKTKEL